VRRMGRIGLGVFIVASLALLAGRALAADTNGGPGGFSLTTLLAIWGAALSTILAGLQGYGIWRDRASVKVEAQPNMVAFPANPGQEDKSYIFVTVRNCGRRPVTITRVALALKEKPNHMLLSQSIGSRKLQEGECTHYFGPQDLVDLQAVRWPVAYDGAGREHKGKLLNWTESTERTPIRIDPEPREEEKF